MPEWKRILNPLINSAIERYRLDTGRDPREDQPGLDDDEDLLAIYLIVSGFPPDGYERTKA
ncbi:hypothetical protein [Bauldia litoralis]|uniref:hypothetical protein n=1 Tax=Bauldia litoralis TaxID=665467 RepID=UPI000B88BDB2|nr:hypothetical protein [Bauldia litoralis]